MPLTFAVYRKSVLYGDLRVEISVLMPKGPLSPEKKVEIFEALEGYITAACAVWFSTEDISRVLHIPGPV